MRGRHSARPPGTPTRAVLAVLGACVLIATAVVVGLTVPGSAGPGSGSHRPAGSASATPGSGSPADRLNATALPPAPSSLSPAPSSKVKPAAAPATAASGAGHRDPFGTAAARYLSGRAGTVLAAVYDVGTGQTWRLGLGQPQAEASVVKLDVLETLLAERDQDQETGLSASDQSLAEEMIEDSDNAAATACGTKSAGRPGFARSIPRPA